MNTLDGSFGFQVSRLANALRASLEKRLAAYGLTAPQWATLMRLREKADWPMKELGTAIGADKATIGGIVQRLENKGLLLRRKDQEDARYLRVSLTEAGRTIAQETASFGAQVNEAVLFHFDEQEKAEFLQMLQRARRAFDVHD